MTQTYPLDRLIRRLPKAKLPESAGRHYRLVIVDLRSKTVLDRKPIVSLGRDLRFFQVSNRRHAEARGPNLKLRSPGTERSLTLNITYEVSCLAGNEERLALALADGDHPAAALNELIAEWVDEFLRQQTAAGVDVCFEYASLRPKIIENLVDRARQEVGAELAPRLRLELESKLGPFSVDTGNFPVRLSDYDREVSLKIVTELLVDHEKKIDACLYHDQLPRLRKLIMKSAREELAAKATLHQFCTELSGTISDLLLGALNDRLRLYGRKLGFLRLESTSLAALRAPSPTIEHVVACDIRECDDKIEVHHRLMLSLVDLGRFRSSRISDLEVWTQRRLDRITRDTLFDTTYLDLLLDFGPGEIKERMENEAAAIGYAVKQMTVIPDLEPLTWKDGINVDHSGQYVTHDSRVEVRLNVVVAGRILDLKNKRLTRYLTPKSPILDDIELSVERETQQLMHDIDPERFYMRFQFSDVPGEQPVREVLEGRLASVLAEKYLIEEISVLAKPLETSLTKRLEELQQGPHKVEVETLPLRSAGRREAVTYSIIFDILGVHEHGWYTFRSKSFASTKEEIDRIREVLSHDARGVLDTIPSELLQYGDHPLRLQMEKILSTTVRKIINSFGLVVSFVSLRRRATKGERAELKVLEEDIEVNKRTRILSAQATGDADLADLKSLYDTRHELIAGGFEDGDPELETVEKRIAEKSREILPYPSREDKKHVRELPPVSREDFDFSEYDMPLLSPTEYKKQLEGRTENEEEES